MMLDETPAVSTGKMSHVAGPPMDTSNILLPSDYASTHAARVPERIALQYQDQRWTYAALDRAIDCMVSILQEHGVAKGDRVALVGRNSDLYFVVLLATVRAGAVIVPINWRNTVPETRHVLSDSDPVLTLAETDFLEVVRSADTRDRPTIAIDDSGPLGLRALINAAQPAPRMPLDPRSAWLQLYTSGTTGAPKGTVSSQFAFGAQREMETVSGHFADWGDDEIMLSPLPSFHIGGMTWVLAGLVRGQTTIITNDTSPAALLDLCLAHSITRTFLVPTLVRGLIEQMDERGLRVPSLRGIHYGAAAMDPQLLDRSVDRLGCRFLQYYGMTEITGSLTILGPADHDASRPALLRSVGRVLPGFEIEIRDPDAKLVEIGCPGEIWIKGPSLLTEYWNRPDATAAALVDGWYRSGDGGRIDANGYLYLTDRIKDMVVTGGENVYPAEVEAVLRQHPAILDCAVFGLPDPKWGEGVTAAVEFRPGQSADADEIIAFARSNLASYKIPRRIESGIEMPRTAAGKVKRGAVRQFFLDKEG